MCVSMTRFYNKWTHSWQYAKCGKCAACQQEKALKRTQRLHNTVYHGYIPLFVTLTYSNDFVPYIRKNDLYNKTYRCYPDKINIYRDKKVRRVRISEAYDMANKVTQGTHIIDTVDCFKYRIFPNRHKIAELKRLRGQGDNNKVGVIYFKDLQNFEKRLRINAERFYNVTKPIYTFKVGEYGASSLRPHFHLIIYVPQESMDECTSAIITSWPFCSLSEWSKKSIQPAINVSSYVSSYVNRGSDFPDLLSARPFRPKHSFSVGLGTQSNSFAPEQIFEAIRRHDLRYVDKRGTSSSTDRFVQFPSYVVNRYFAKFKGYTRLSNSDLRRLCSHPTILFDTKNEGTFYLKKLGLIHEWEVEENYVIRGNDFVVEYCPIFDYAKIRSVVNHLELRIQRFLKDFVYYEDGKRFVGLPDNIWNRQLFADYMYSYWRTYSSQMYKKPLFEADNIIQVLECYYNISDVRIGLVHSDLFLYLPKYPYISNPNAFHHILQSTNKLTTIFENMSKSRKVNNESMVNTGVNV